MDRVTWCHLGCVGLEGARRVVCVASLLFYYTDATSFGMMPKGELGRIFAALLAVLPCNTVGRSAGTTAGSTVGSTAGSAAYTGVPA